jgi:hypothetical protein
MKNWVLIAAGIAVVLLIGGKSFNLGALKLPGGSSSADELTTPIVGRWDAPSGADYIRFREDGYFRSEILGTVREGTFTGLEGGAIEFVVPYRVQNPRTRKIVEMKDIREVKYTLEKDTLKLRINGVWMTFRKATPAETPDPAPELPPMFAPAPVQPAMPKKPVQA